MKKYFLIILLCSVNAYAKPVNFEKLYQSWGVTTKADAKKAEIMWTQEFIVDRSCASCHTNNLKKYGAHIKTKKRIKPLSSK
jgi:mono/diheme cytochrome c family protein